MLRKALLALAMLAVFVTPLTARAETATRRDHDRHDGDERHERYYRYPISGSYTPTCAWQGGSWEYQGPELGADGSNYYYVPRWVVPPQYVCS